jgi:hypothetical protein
MAKENESRGLKIAVAAFISLSVILAVACYFLYAAYTQAEARRVAAEARNRFPVSTAPKNPR